MQFKDRISQIIDYPVSPDGIDEYGIIKPNPLHLIATDPKYIIYVENNIFQYPSPEIVAADKNFAKEKQGDFISKREVTLNPSETNVWFGTSKNIHPLEGYYIGYELDQEKVNFASLMNTPEFALQLFTDLTPSTPPKVSFHYFLHALSLAPPIPITTDATPTQGEEFQLNPSILFKNNAGVYSIPKPYVWWLGGIWDLRSLPSYSGYYTYDYITFDGDVNAGWNGVTFAIDPKKKNTNFFRPMDVGNKGKNTLWVPPQILMPYPKSSTRNAIKVVKGYPATGTEVFYEIDPLMGVGHYQDVFNEVHNEFYGNYLPQNDSILDWNVTNKMKSFMTSVYNLDDTDPIGNVDLSLYATYSILNLSSSWSTFSLPIVSSTTSSAGSATPFEIYSAIWKYIFYNLTSDPPLTYPEIRVKILDNYKSSPWTKVQVQNVEKAMFTTASTSREKITHEYDASDYIVITYELFKSNDYFTNFIDLIGLQVIQFVESSYSAVHWSLDKYYVTDPSFACVLYPSAGGTVGLQYIVKSLCSPYGSFSLQNYQNSRDNNNRFTAVMINLILNSCRFVWGSGPFVGDSLYKVSDFVSTEDFNVIRKPSVLDALDTRFLYNNSVHTKRENQTYILDPNRIKYRIKTAIGTEYNDFIDYIGCGALDVFAGVFNSITTVDKNNVSKAKDILMSMLVVDRNDFKEITIDNQKFSVDQQIDYLTMYTVWNSMKYTSGTDFIAGKAVNILKVMNASLTQAQTVKITRVVQTLISERSLLNVGSVFDYGAVNSTGSIVTNVLFSKGSLQNMFSRALANGALNEKTDKGKFIKIALFGTQSVPVWASNRNGDDYEYQKYYYRGKMSTTQLASWANYFFEQLNVSPTSATVKIAKDLMMLYLKQGTTYADAERQVSFGKMADIVRKWLESSDRHINSYLTSAKDYLGAGKKPLTDAILKDFVENGKSDINIMKQKTYYNIKAIFDNWIRVMPNGNAELVYNYNRIVTPNSTPDNNGSLIDHFLFLDRANRDIGHNLLVNIDWLRPYLSNNLTWYNDVSTNTNTNVSLYTFLSALAMQHSSLIHALPAFIDFGNFTINDGSNYAGDLFGTFDYVEVTPSNPKLIFQFIGNTNTILNTAQNKVLRSASKSYSLMSTSAKENQKSNISSNIGDGVNTPKDLIDANAMAFVVDFGEQHQQIFSNLQLDQSEYQTTEESVMVITKFAENHTWTQGGDLFAIFTERSYTAQVDSLGNLMIQPLMFFELTNVPLFYGTYWITNVRHMITPNDIQTTFKGVRQPMAVLPSKRDVLLQLAELNISSLLGVEAVKPSPSAPTAGTTAGSSAGASSGVKTYYPELPLISPPPPPTLLSYKEAKQKLLKITDDSTAKAIFAIMWAEARRKSSSFSSAGGYNYTGIQTDAGRWSGSELIVGRFLRKDAVRLREFAQFESDDTFIKFMVNRGKAKGFVGNNGNQWVERYLNSWVYNNLLQKNKDEYNRLYPLKLAIYNTAIKEYNNV